LAAAAAAAALAALELAAALAAALAALELAALELAALELAAALAALELAATLAALELAAALAAALELAAAALVALELELAASLELAAAALELDHTPSPSSSSPDQSEESPSCTNASMRGAKWKVRSRAAGRAMVGAMDGFIEETSGRAIEEGASLETPWDDVLVFTSACVHAADRDDRVFSVHSQCASCSRIVRSVYMGPRSDPVERARRVLQLMYQCGGGEFPSGLRAIALDLKRLLSISMAVTGFVMMLPRSSRRCRVCVARST
jgi:hypothetical protein